MKRTAPFILLLAVLSVISGYLMSEASWIGRIGMGIFYQQYTFLKIWWQGALAAFGVWMVLFILHAIVQRSSGMSSAKIVHIVALLAALAGLYGTYHNFRHDFSHRLMGERFHIGFYLFWVGWALICLYFLLQRRIISADNKGASTS